MNAHTRTRAHEMPLDISRPDLAPSRCRVRVPNRMEFDTAVTWNIARFLDNSDLEKVFMSDLMPHLIAVSKDERWWHARCETYIRRHLDFDSDGDSWRVAYEIVTRPSHTEIWNKEDNLLAVRMHSLLWQKPRNNDLLRAVEMRTPRIVRYLLSLSEVKIAPHSNHLLCRGIRSGCVEVVRALLSNPDIASDVNPANSGLMAVLECERGSVADHIAILELLIETAQQTGAGPLLNDDWMVHYLNRNKISHMMMSYLWKRPEIDVTAPEVLKAVVEACQIACSLCDTRLDIAKVGKRALEIACRGGYSDALHCLLEDPRVVPSKANLDQALASDPPPERILTALLCDVRIDAPDRCAAMMRWLACDRKRALEFWDANRPKFPRLEFLEDVCDREQEDAKLVEAILEGDIDPRDCQALVYAAMRGHVEITRLLLGHSRHTSNVVMQALKIAASEGWVDMTRLLSRHID